MEVNTQPSWLVNTWFSPLISHSATHNTDGRFIILCVCVFLAVDNLFFKNTCPCVCVCVILSSYCRLTCCTNLFLRMSACFCTCMCLHLLGACVCVFCCWKIYTAVSHLHQSSLVLSQSAMLLRLDIPKVLLCFTVHTVALRFYLYDAICTSCLSLKIKQISIIKQTL